MSINSPASGIEQDTDSGRDHLAIVDNYLKLPTPKTE